MGGWHQQYAEGGIGRISQMMRDGRLVHTTGGRLTNDERWEVGPHNRWEMGDSPMMRGGRLTHTTGGRWETH